MFVILIIFPHKIINMFLNIISTIRKLQIFIRIVKKFHVNSISFVYLYEICLGQKLKCVKECQLFS